MTRDRIFSSAGILVAGLLVGQAAQAAEPSRPGLGPLPGAALVLPSDVTFVLGLDVKKVVTSPVYERMKKSGGMKPNTLSELEKSAGIVPERDLTSFVMAGSSAGDAAMLVFGQFDLARVTAAIEADGKATKSTVRGVPAYLGPGAKGKNQMLLALVDSGMLALGTPARVEAMLAARAEKAQPFLGSTVLVAGLRKLRSGPAFWMVGDGNLTRGMPGGPAGVTLPALESLSVTGEFIPDLNLSLTGQAVDAAEAKKMADMLRGLIGLAAMQGGQKPEIQALVSGVVVTSEGAKVMLDARIAYDVLDKVMTPAPKPPSAEPATR